DLPIAHFHTLCSVVSMLDALDADDSGFVTTDELLQMCSTLRLDGQKCLRELTTKELGSKQREGSSSCAGSLLLKDN
ncbi:unnamed protein product, partial [Amoebophrya sp. A25]